VVVMRMGTVDMHRDVRPAPGIGPVGLVGAAAAFLLAAAYLGTWLALVYPCLVALLVPVVVVDLRELRIPNRLLVVGVVGVAVAVTAVATVYGRPEVVGWALLGSLLYTLPLLAVHVLSPEGLGFGDVKLGVLLGGALGMAHPLLAPLGLLAACLAEVAARVATGRLRGVRAFAPALAFGAVAVLLAAPGLVEWFGFVWAW
jgi:leader peptidase (prepilin peptidase)/N-methyltransferase